MWPQQALVEKIKIELQTNAVILGENHGHSGARDIAIALMEQGVVRTLFIEQDWRNLEEVLHTAAGNRDFAAVEAEPYYKMVCNLYDRANPTPYSRLLRAAVEAGVIVHFYDTHPDASNYSRARTAAGVANRNKTMAANFAHVSGHERNGCLLLAGSDHATIRPDDPEKLKNFGKTLGARTGIPFVHIIRC